jgi:hypothetical protein
MQSHGLVGHYISVNQSLFGTNMQYFSLGLQRDVVYLG